MPPPRAGPTLTCPKTDGESGCTLVQIPFSLQDMRHIKSDLEKLLEDPEKYIKIFQNLIQMFNLS